MRKALLFFVAVSLAAEIGFAGQISEH